MKDKKFFKEIPYPFCKEEEMRLKNKILSSLPIKKYNLFVKFAIGFALILIMVSVHFLISNKKVEGKKKEKIIVLNPLKIKSEEIVLKDFPFPQPQFEEEKIQDIPFHIAKYDHSVILQWDANNFQKFRVKKCQFLPPKNDCAFVQETDKNYFIDEDLDDAKFVVYIIEAVIG